MDKKLETALKAFKLKDEKRTGWELREVENPESVAGHSWGLGLLCLLYGDRKEIDMEKLLKIAVAHDITEAETGDIATRADSENQKTGKKEKQEMEKKAINKLTGKRTEELKQLWEEYEKGETKEAKFVKDMDKIENLVQALVYQREKRYPQDKKLSGYKYLNEFFKTAKPRIKTDIGKKLYKQIEKEYRKEKLQ